MSQILYQHMLRQGAVRSLVGLRCTGTFATSQKLPLNHRISSELWSPLVRSHPNAECVRQIHYSASYMGSRKDIMKGWNPTGENPAMNEDFDDEKEVDNEVRILKGSEQRMDEIVVVMNGEHVTVPVDGLYTQIRCMNHEQILSMVGSSYKYLDAIEDAIPLSFRRLFYVCKLMDKAEFELVMSYLPTHKDFQILCGMVAAQAPKMEPEKALDMLYYLHFFRARTNSPYVKVFLQLAMSFINDLPLDQLTILSHTVHAMTTSDTIKILREGLKILAKHFHPKDIASLDLWRKIVLFETLGAHMTNEFKQALLEAIAKESYELKLNTAILLLNALSVNNYHCALDNVCLEIISARTHKLDMADMKTVLSACTNLHLYAPEVVDAVADQACKEGSPWTFDDKLFLVKQLRTQGHVHKTFLDSIVAQLPDYMKDVSLEAGSHVICYLSDARYALKEKEVVSKFAENIAKVTLDQEKAETIVDVAVALHFLEVPVPKRVLAVVNSCHEMEAPKELTRIILPDKVLCLGQSLDGSNVTSAAMESIPKFPRKESSMKGVFDYIGKNISGMEVLHGECTKSGHFVDHMVTVNSGSDNPKKVAVLVLPQNCFTRNTGQLKCIPYTICKAVQKDGHLTVVFNEKSWSHIEERDRVEYLLQKLQHAEEHQDLVMIGLDNLG